MGVLDDEAAQQILEYEDDNSPFPEVRAVVSPVDDPLLPVNNVRMWVIGIIFTIVRCPYSAYNHSTYIFPSDR